jgi:hypothetical protein
VKLIDTDCCDLKVGRSANTRMVSVYGSINGHLKFDGAQPYIIWGLYLCFEDGERSIKAYWRGLEGLRSFAYLKRKSIILTVDENSDDEDFGCYYSFYKDLNWLRIGFIDIADKGTSLKIQAHRNIDDAELDEEEIESRYTYIEGNFNISFEGIHMREYDYARSLNYLDQSEMKETINKIIDVKNFLEPNYSVGEPYAKKGSCLFEWKGICG